MNKVIKSSCIAGGVYALIHTCHWLLTRYYVHYCNPSGITGFMYSFFASPIPNCTIVLTFMDYTSKLYTQQIVQAIFATGAGLWAFTKN